MIRKASIVGAVLWALVITSLRATRWPNDFSKEHWFIDYRYGFVKRGLVGTLVSLTARLFHARPTESLVDILATAAFVAFCGGLVWSAVHLLRRSDWSTDVALVVLVFVSSPFVVMSAHLIGYYDNLIIALAMSSIALIFQRRLWLATLAQATAMLIHESSLLVGFPAFCVAWWLVDRRAEPAGKNRWPIWPLLLPPAVFVLIAVGQTMAPIDREHRLTDHLATYPFIAANLAAVRVPHWITITFYDSYILHKGQVAGRVLSQSMIALVMPSLLAILGFVIDANRVRARSAQSLMLAAACLAPQAMHLVAWDTARIWTYSIVCAYLLFWSYVEAFPTRTPGSQFVRFVCLVALIANIVGVTPLMDGLKEHFDLNARLLLYLPLVAAAWIGAT